MATGTTSTRIRGTFDPIEFTVRLDTLPEAKMLFALLRSRNAGEFEEIVKRDALANGVDDAVISKLVTDVFAPMQQALLDAYNEQTGG